MKKQRTEIFDVIIIGGSYAGLSAAMALGRSLRTVLVINSNDSCNKQTPRSHNFLTQDGETPHDIARKAMSQVQKYETVQFIDGLATKGLKAKDHFEIKLESGEEFKAKKLIFATGLKDIMLDVLGFSECWGISILHCPYCHGYEVKNKKLALLGNGVAGFDLAKLISNWSSNLTLFTNGKSILPPEQENKLKIHGVNIIEKNISHFKHDDGYIKHIAFNDGTFEQVEAAFARVKFKQKSTLPSEMGCEITEHGFIHIDEMQKTTVPGIYAAGDNSYGLRAVSVAVAAGTKVGAFINHELINESFL